MPPKSKADPTHDILRILKDKNRPYSAITLGDELHGEYGASAVKKAVEQLADDGIISCKVSGKAKLYFARQDGLPVATPEQLDLMDQNIENLRNTSAQLKEKVEMLRSRRNELSNTKPIDELRNYRIEVEQKLEKEEERKNQLIQMTEGITPEDASKFQKDFNERCAQWRQRKNKCKEIVDQISEGCGKKPSEIFEELDLETDENLGLKLEYKDKKYIVTENS